MKTPRRPECHLPDWAKNLRKKDQQKEILEMVEAIVLRYRNSKAIEIWQLESEPFLYYPACPWIIDKKFLKKEIELVKSLDKRPILISEPGEHSLIGAARFGDIVGMTLYRKAYFHSFEIHKIFEKLPRFGFYVSYPFPSVFYYRKTKLIEFLFNKEIICVELQAEPWGPGRNWEIPLSEQEKTMNLDQFKYNIEFAKNTGLSKFYLWGSEWWYWLKKIHQRPEFWEEAKKLF